MSVALRSTGDPALDGQIARALRYGQTRWAEVWLSATMVVYGLVLLSPGNTFDLPSYRVIDAFADERAAGLAAAGAGLGRLVALWINGRRGRQTSPVRMLGCMAGFLLWLAVGLGFACSAPPLSTGLVYWVWAAAEMHSLTRATRDAYAYDSFGTQRRRRARERCAPAA